MRGLALLNVFFCVNSWANGSSGIGNRFLLSPGLETEVPRSRPLARRGSKVVDPSTGETLVEVGKIDRKELRRFGKHLVRSRLGRVDGFEFLPDLREAGAQFNFWVICGKQRDCTLLTPATSTNPGLLDVIGGLVPASR